MSGDVLLIEQRRGPIAEHLHRGCLCVVNTAGDLVSFAGDPAAVVYAGGCLLPLEATAFLEHGLDRDFRLTEEETVMIAASHLGGAHQMAALESLALKLDIKEKSLLCPPVLPAFTLTRDMAIRERRQPRRFYHSAAGRHLAAIALCRALGGDERTYYRESNPAMQLSRRQVAACAGLREQELIAGADDCGMPVYAMPLHRLAQAYAAFARPETLSHPGLRETALRLGTLFGRHPTYLGYDKLLCSELNRDPNLFAKEGGGIFCFGLRQQKLGVALFMSDGGDDHLPLVTAEILQQLGYENRPLMEKLYRLHPATIKNAAGARVGEYRAVFQLSPP